jgi:hypothetical protein
MRTSELPASQHGSTVGIIYSPENYPSSSQISPTPEHLQNQAFQPIPPRLTSIFSLGIFRPISRRA